MALMPKVNPELEAFLPRPNEDLLTGLQAKILRDGIREPIFVSEDGDILDGYSRFGIYQILKLKFPIEVIHGPKTLAEKKAWMRDHQLNRRNLSPTEFSYYIGLRFEDEKNENPRGKPSATVADDSPETADRIATETGVPARTVERAAAFARAVDLQPAKVRPALIAGDVAMKVVTAAAKNGQKLFCERCTRIGPVKGCEKCSELVARKSAPKKSKPKAGKETFDWKGFDKNFGAVVRAVDALKKAYPEESASHAKAVSLLDQFAAHFAAWKKKVTG